MEDEKGKDEKIVAVPAEKIDPTYSSINDIKDLPEIIRKKITHFFEHYKELEPGKFVKVTGWGGVEEAQKMIKEAIQRVTS